MRVPADCLPVLPYVDITNNRLKVAKCTDAACAGSATLTTVDPMATTNGPSSIVIDTDGFPIIRRRRSMMG